MSTAVTQVLALALGSEWENKQSGAFNHCLLQYLVFLHKTFIFPGTRFSLSLHLLRFNVTPCIKSLLLFTSWVFIFFVIKFLIELELYRM